MEDPESPFDPAKSGGCPDDAGLSARRLVLASLPMRGVHLRFSAGQGAFDKMTTAAERQKQVANCRADTWTRLLPTLSSLHVSRRQGPEVLVEAVHNAPPGCKAEAMQLLRAMSLRSWSLQRLSGPYAANHRLGFCVVTGAVSWWLSFEPGPHLRLRSVERVAPQA